MCRLQKIRERQADRQGWSCTYCEQPMWRSDPAAFAALHGLTLRQALLLQLTAEHLLPASDGGADEEPNIAAACLYCNRKRHHARNILAPEAYRRKVRRQLRRGGWHGIRLVTNPRNDLD